MMPKVDTFEHDIVDEIKRKDASMTEISAASNNVGNEIILPPKKPVFLIVLGVFFLLFLVALIGVGYYYYHDTLLPPSSQEVKITPLDVPKMTTGLDTLSPTLAMALKGSVTQVEKKDRGYILTINDYSSVFAYMTRNESDYILELALLFSQPEAIATSTPIQLPPPVPSVPDATTTQLQATSTATTTKPVIKKTPVKTPTKTTSKTASSTKLTTATSTLLEVSTTTPLVVKPPVIINGPHFTDITVENQNMRVWTSGKRTVVYAFFGNTMVAISDTPEGILALKSGILH